MLSTVVLLLAVNSACAYILTPPAATIYDVLSRPELPFRNLSALVDKEPFVKSALTRELPPGVGLLLAPVDTATFPVLAPTPGSPVVGASLSAALGASLTLQRVLLYHFVPTTNRPFTNLWGTIPGYLTTAEGGPVWPQTIVNVTAKTVKYRVAGVRNVVDVTDPYDIVGGTLYNLVDGVKQVLLPPIRYNSIVDSATALEVPIAVSMFQAAGLRSIFSASTLPEGFRGTFFLPTNAALVKVLVENPALLGRSETLRDILLFHMIPTYIFSVDLAKPGNVRPPGALNSAFQLVPARQIVNTNNPNIDVIFKDGTVTLEGPVNSAKVVLTDGKYNVLVPEVGPFFAVVHQIDTVLLPYPIPTSSNPFG